MTKFGLRHGPTAQDECLLPAAEFVEVLAHERRRSDRSGQVFSLIVMRFDQDQATARQATVITEVLAARLREIDLAGWLHDGGVGLLTPYTDANGAKRLVEAIINKTPSDHLPSTFDIYEYPPKNSPDDHNKTPGELVEAPQSGQNPGIESLLSPPIPLWKRTIDVLGAATGLVLLAPLMTVAATAVRLSSAGPVIFAQRRAGWGGKPFWMYKFRTMVVDAEQQKRQLLACNEQDGPAFKIDNDPRITRVGRWLRKTSIDELPQLWNVLRGEMSLVGPRPLPCDESDGCRPWQRRRLSVTPGMTCSWQVNDRTQKIPFAQWMRMDLQYVKSFSLKQDFRLMLKTVAFVLARRGQ